MMGNPPGLCGRPKRERSAQVLLVALLTVGCGAMVGCSVLVSPDKDRLGARVDGGPVTGCVPADCDDQLDCTADSCDEDSCQNVPDDALCGSDERCDTIAGCVRTSCERDEDCDNGNACDGVETCVSNGCEAGQPINCDDGLDCTVDRCQDGACSNEANNELCNYEDLCVVGVCGEHAEADGRGCRPVSKTCDDGDGCTLDVCNPDTGQCEFGKIDEDGDGVAAVSEVCQQGDCDDSNPSIYPGAKEFCNGRDENCNGRSDESCTSIPDSCSGVLDVDLKIGQTRTIEFEVSQFTSRYVTSCHGPAKLNGPDAVFRIRPDAEADVLIDATESAFDTILAVSPGNCSQNAFGSGVCDDDSPGTNPKGSRIWRQRTGDFYLLVDSVEGSSGRARVTVKATTPAQNLCGASLDISLGGTWIGKTRDSPTYDGACDSAGAGREGLANFVSAAGGKARFEGLAFSNGFFDHAMYIYEDNCNVSLACDGYLPLLLEPTLAAGQRYILFVDGANSNAPFAVKYTPP